MYMVYKKVGHINQYLSEIHWLGFWYTKWSSDKSEAKLFERDSIVSDLVECNCWLKEESN